MLAPPSWGLMLPPTEILDPPLLRIGTVTWLDFYLIHTTARHRFADIDSRKSRLCLRKWHHSGTDFLHIHLCCFHILIHWIPMCTDTWRNWLHQCRVHRSGRVRSHTRWYLSRNLTQWIPPGMHRGRFQLCWCIARCFCKQQLGRNLDKNFKCFV